MNLIIRHIESFDYSHIKGLLDNLKTLEFSEDTISLYEIHYPKEIIRYTVVHNKKSYTVTSDRFDT
jgi:hypothetical protein